MASSGDIAEVRVNTNEPTDVVPYTDAVIGAYIDLLGVAGASAKIWRQKAATYVDEATQVSEAGASHRYESHKHALAMAAYWDGIAAGEVVVEEIIEGPIVNDIVRET